MIGECRWEYRTVVVDGDDMVEMLDNLGTDRWEVALLLGKWHDGDSNMYSFLLKRQDLER
jgi:hypothetical protein